MVAKVETMVVSPQHGSEPVLSEAFYSDHKSFGGPLLPAKVKLLYDHEVFLESETIDYKMRATLDPLQFVAPQ